MDAEVKQLKASRASKHPAATCGSTGPNSRKSSKYKTASAAIADARNAASMQGGHHVAFDAVSSDSDVQAAAGSKSAAAEHAGFQEAEVSQIQEGLLSWYDRVQRVLPWRRNPHHTPQPTPTDDSPAAANCAKPKKLTKQQAAAEEAAALLAAAKPAPAELPPQEFAYYVWVSEIMLQQTQVARVIAYFNKWVSKWPTVTALASATQEEVNEVWAGLGYYRRAKYLLDGAKYIVDELDGRFPETAAGLRQVPGVGPYTAAAIASIAFNDQAAAVDGNVIRVLSRLRALRGNPTKLVKAHNRLAAEILHPERPGCHNQAMMELGATVCKPVSPACESCPVKDCCAAVKQVAEYVAAGGSLDVEDAPRVTDYPDKVVKPTKAEQHVAVCVVKLLVLPNAALAVAGTAAAAATTAKHPAAAANKGSIRSFFKPKPFKDLQQNQQQPIDTDNSNGDIQAVSQQQLCENDLLAAGAATHYLLVQRPETGLLAGLWEFPGVVMDVEPTPVARRSAVDQYLVHTLGLAVPGSCSSSGTNASSKRSKHSGGNAGNAAAAAAAKSQVQMMHRRQLGSAVHIFSHIRQTLHAEELVLLAPSVQAACAAVESITAAAGGPVAAPADSDQAVGSTNCEKHHVDSHQQGSLKSAVALQKRALHESSRPSVRWVTGDQIAAQGLTSGVRKVLQLSMK